MLQTVFYIGVATGIVVAYTLFRFYGGGLHRLLGGVR